MLIKKIREIPKSEIVHYYFGGAIITSHFNKIIITVYNLIF